MFAGVSREMGERVNPALVDFVEAACAAVILIAVLISRSIYCYLKYWECQTEKKRQKKLREWLDGQ